MRNVLMVVFGVGILCSSAGQTAAQSAQRWSIQGSLLSEALFGEVGEGVDPGGGFELQLRYTTETAWSFGGGFQFTFHGVPDDEFPSDILITGLFFEPRYVFPRANFAPYLSGRFASSLLSLTLEDFPEDPADAFGATINFGGGALMRLSPRLNLDIGATYGYTNWGDFMFRGRFLSAGGPGTNLILRLGLAFGF
jgi:hypothetical protein